MSRSKHLHVVTATIKIAIPYSPEDNLLLLTTQIKEQARKLTGFVSCETGLGKLVAPITSLPSIHDVAATPQAHPLDVPASLKASR